MDQAVDPGGIHGRLADMALPLSLLLSILSTDLLLVLIVEWSNLPFAPFFLLNSSNTFLREGTSNEWREEETSPIGKTLLKAVVSEY